MFEKLYINNLFTKALSQMRSYAKFSKVILFDKGKLDDHEIVALSAECSIAIQNKLFTKLKNPGNFYIPCLIRNVSIDCAWCDLRSSVSLMPSLFIKSWI